MVRRDEDGVRTKNPRKAKGVLGNEKSDREVLISKKLSYVLRHAAAKEGVKMDENGYVVVADLLKWRTLRSMKATFSEIKEAVANNDKKRFQLVPVPELSKSTSTILTEEPTTIAADEEQSENPSQYLIRASQGHSLPIASSAILAPVDPTSPDTPTEVVHGTYEKSWPAILASGGLKPMGRTHVHFAANLPGLSAPAPVDDFKPSEETSGTSDAEKGIGKEKEKEKVISGMRGSASLLVWVDLKRSATEDGLKWWRSANGVLLTEGGEKGIVGVKFINRVVDRRTGKVVWENGKEFGVGIGIVEGERGVGKKARQERRAAEGGVGAEKATGGKRSVEGGGEKPEASEEEIVSKMEAVDLENA